MYATGTDDSNAEGFKEARDQAESAAENEQRAHVQLANYEQAH